MNDPFSFRERIDERLSINFFVCSPSKIIEFIIGFSSTIIFKLLFDNSTETLAKNLVSYNFLISKLISLDS